MSISEARLICSTIDCSGCGIVREVYNGPSAETGRRAAPGLPLRDQLGNPRLVRQALRDECPDSLPGDRIVVELGEATEQEHLVDGEGSPAPIEIQLGEQEVEVDVRGRDRDRQVARVEGGRGATGPAVGAGRGQEMIASRRVAGVERR